MLKKSLLLVGIIVLGFVAFVASRPATFEVQRSLTIAATPEIVFAQLNDFQSWDAWSPWDEIDPEMVKTLSGAEMGVGAEYHWVGNDQAGEGHMTITESRPHEHISVDLQFLKPFEASSIAAFDLAPAGEGTRVTWSMSGENNFIGKTVGIFMDMDASVGGDFERGLASIKEVSEAEMARVQMEAGNEGESAAAGM